jgi:hypothetical protein
MLLGTVVTENVRLFFLDFMHQQVHLCCRLMTSGATSLSEQMKQQWRNMTGSVPPFVILFSPKYFTIAQADTAVYRYGTYSGWTLFPTP